MATTAAMPVTALPSEATAALDGRAALDAVVGGAARFRLEFSRDARTKELRWVLFTGACTCAGAEGGAC